MIKQKKFEKWTHSWMGKKRKEMGEAGGRQGTIKHNVWQSQ